MTKRNRLFVFLLIWTACAITMIMPGQGEVGLFCVEAAHAAPVQWVTGTGANNHWYEAVEAPSGISWTNAASDATSKGGYLATITSEAENNFVFNLINNQKYWRLDNRGWNDGPWIGGYQAATGKEPSEGWAWVKSEETWNYSKWAGWQPNDWNGDAPAGEDYLNYFEWGTNRAPTWNDISDTSIIKAYVFEKDSNHVPVPPAIWLLGSGIAGIIGIKRRLRG